MIKDYIKTPAFHAGVPGFALEQQKHTTAGKRQVFIGVIDFLPRNSSEFSKVISTKSTTELCVVLLPKEKKWNQFPKLKFIKAVS